MIWVLLTAVLAWGWLLVFRAGFWRADQRLPEAPPPETWPAVAAIIPARDEAETIAEVIGAHAASTYPGTLSVVLVDDNSTDGTGDLARGAGRGTGWGAGRGTGLTVLEGTPLPPGWSGKLWALEQGIARAAETAPDARWLLLTDADIRHAPDTLARLVAHAEAHGLAMVSLMARLDCRGLWGRLLIPAFVFFFQKLYPFPLVNDPASPVAGAAGGCVLIRRDALAEIGGIGSIRGALIDDCTLAARIKRGPPRRAIWLGLADAEAISLRDNRALGSVWKMVARTAFTQLRHSWALLAGSVIGMAAIYLAGPLAVLTAPVHHDPGLAALGALAWALMAIAYVPTVRAYGQSALHSLSLPLAAVLYMAMTLDSARRHALGAGGAWKGRTYGPAR